MLDVPQPFKENLLNVDEIMPAVLAEMLLLVHHYGCTCKTDELCEELTAADPLHIGTRYRFKIQRFLEALALDMTPHKAWDGDITIPPYFRIGGRIFQPYQRTQLRDYLYHHTYFEHPSTSRYDCDKLHLLEDGRIVFNLPLQIHYSYAEVSVGNHRNPPYTALNIEECTIRLPRSSQRPRHPDKRINLTHTFSLMRS